jgi:hypothetical protein
MLLSASRAAIEFLRPHDMRGVKILQTPSFFRHNSGNCVIICAQREYCLRERTFIRVVL